MPGICLQASAGAGLLSHTVNIHTAVLSRVWWLSSYPNRAQGGGATSSGPAAGLGNEIILQGFNWESHRGHGWYKMLKDQVPDIAAAGFSSIWLPPPSESVSPQGCERHSSKPCLHPHADACGQALITAPPLSAMFRRKQQLLVWSSLTSIVPCPKGLRKHCHSAAPAAAVWMKLIGAHLLCRGAICTPQIPAD